MSSTPGASVQAAAAQAVPGPAARLARDAVAAVVVSLAGIAFYISAASLMFQGPLAPYLPVGIASLLLGAGVLSLLCTWRSGLPLASLGPEPAPTPVLAAITVGAASAVTGPEVLPTALVALALAGVLIGASWWLLGLRGWGDLIRYIPFPVVGGFLAAVGWLMLTGGLGVASAQSFSLSQAWQWIAGVDLRVAAGLAIGFAIWRLTLRFPHPMTLPAAVLGSVLLVHGGLAAAGIGLDAAREAGWLLRAFDDTRPAMPLAPSVLGAVRWDAVLAQLPLMVSVVIVGTISLLLSVTSLETAWDERSDINRDLRVLGAGNLVTAALGGTVGGVSISRSMLNRAAGASGRGSVAIKGVLCLLALGWGGPALALVPRPVLGGVLVFLGLGILKAWLFDLRRRLPPVEMATVVAMLVITAFGGFLPAVAFGVLACCVAFAVSSARFAPVRRLIARSAWPSKVERSLAESAWLQREGDRQRIVELQGVLFFGSATRLTREMETLLASSDRPALLLFDFQHVRGVDTSAAQALARLFKAARRVGVEVELSGLDGAQRAALQAGGALAGPPPVHADVDAAVATWDDAALARRAAPPASLDDALREWLPLAVPVERLLGHFEPRALAAGEWLFREGDASDALYLVQSGRVSIVAGAAGAGERLLRVVHAGSAIGEMGLFRDTPRSASARADVASVLLALSRARFDRLSALEPEVAAALYRLFVMQMAGRVEQLGRQAQALAR